MATYLSFVPSLAPIGGRADESTTSLSSGCFTWGSSDIATGNTRLADHNVEAADVVEVSAVPAVDELAAVGMLGAKSGRPASEAAGGRTPRGVDVYGESPKPWEIKHMIVLAKETLTRRGLGCVEIISMVGSDVA